MFENFKNLTLKSLLKNTVISIPKDLQTWNTEIKRTRSGKKKVEYYGMAEYYKGKLFAYLYVLEELGEHRFCEKFLEVHKITRNNDRFVKTTPWQQKSLSDHL